MAQPTGNEPDFLPDGSLSIHGKRAKPFHFKLGQQPNGSPNLHLPETASAQHELKQKASEELDKAWKGH